MKIIRLVLLVCLWPGLLYAAGLEKVASIDRALWPEAIDSQLAFDRASAAEILQFAHVMAKVPLASAEDISRFTGVKQVSVDSVVTWRSKTQQRMLEGYRFASRNQSVKHWDDLVRIAHERLPAFDSKWRESSEQFYHYYLFEQVRLAALFPRISSEILTFNDTEVTGERFEDGEFLLTFDDGPHPTRTQTLINQLNDRGIQAYFFVLGSKLVPAEHKNWYQSQCLGSHGWRHHAHKALDKSKGSIHSTDQAMAQLASLSSDTAFRPPYGMRSLALSQWLQRQDTPVYLWTIDSQDWNARLSSRQVADRVMTLMLLWRKGIVLFHDIHPHATVVLNDLDDMLHQAGLKWRSCS
ncbi:polysaccharide deacetylase family protein [Photobacterium halotolerans]|uniref:Polysaccharide deacetylase family protein n=1 Tax=Photobacterium halotolerans TaxID=265726 RepID=A0A7X5BIE7_9GAMM|nr:polysaccharide deacetylase family protein [Photobacterium halotolerans]NAW67679.1 polysaccharide deacetylase family protein [Photobacterium halotolerans]NAX46355.1 polysaccharide deacetylase family protein [Photobacterium halotolerans]